MQFKQVSLSNKSIQQTEMTHSPNSGSAADLSIRRSNSVDISFLENDSLSMDEKLAYSSKYTPSFKGYLEMIVGPMFAGKSTELLRRV